MERPVGQAFLPDESGHGGGERSVAADAFVRLESLTYSPTRSAAVFTDAPGDVRPANVRDALAWKEWPDLEDPRSGPPLPRPPESEFCFTAKLSKNDFRHGC